MSNCNQIYSSNNNINALIFVTYTPISLLQPEQLIHTNNLRFTLAHIGEVLLQSGRIYFWDF